MTRSVKQAVKELSGGNQQKVVIAKWLGMEPQILIMDEPTAGVDIGTKAEIVGMIRDFADAGGSVIMISSELPELLAVSDRLLILRDGHVESEIDRRDHQARGGPPPCSSGDERMTATIAETRQQLRLAPIRHLRRASSWSSLFFAVTLGDRRLPHRAEPRPTSSARRRPSR